MIRRLALILLLLLSASPGWAQKTGQVGRFEYYVLSLSWSPSFCATRSGKSDGQQCGADQPSGFVVHGLWPQYEMGGYPSHCPTPQQMTDDARQSARRIMPSDRLAAHEWKRHGTCSGMTAQRYFDRVAQAAGQVRIPAPLQAVDAQRSWSVRQVQDLFVQANPDLPPGSVRVQCRGQYAAEVRICMDRDLAFRKCGADVKDRCAGAVLFPPGLESR